MNRKVNGVVLDASQGDIHILYLKIAELEGVIKDLETMLIAHLDSHFDDEYYDVDSVE